MYTLKGEVKAIGDTQQVTDSFKKREFVVLDASGQYPQTILFQATQDRVELLDTIKVRQQVEVFFNLRGREWVNPEGDVKYFNSLDTWKIELPIKVEATNENFVPEGEEDDQIPF